MNNVGDSVKKANLAMLDLAAHRLGCLCNDVVFCGGSTAGLFITDPVAPDVRMTEDVDCIVDVISLNEYYQFEEKLRARGFVQSGQDEVICRWHKDELILDVMPSEENILGFSNRWSKSSIQHAMLVSLPSKRLIKSISSAYFLATKLEAFQGRGNNDYLSSHDMEDLISVMDGCPIIVNDVKNSDAEVRKYLSIQFSALLNKRSFHDALFGHLNYGLVAEDRVRIVIERMGELCHD